VAARLAVGGQTTQGMSRSSVWSGKQKTGNHNDDEQEANEPSTHKLIALKLRENGSQTCNVFVPCDLSGNECVATCIYGFNVEAENFLYTSFFVPCLMDVPVLSGVTLIRT